MYVSLCMCVRVCMCVRENDADKDIQAVLRPLQGEISTKWQQEHYHAHLPTLQAVETYTIITLHKPNMTIHTHQSSHLRTTLSSTIGPTCILLTPVDNRRCTGMGGGRGVVGEGSSALLVQKKALVIQFHSYCGQAGGQVGGWGGGVRMREGHTKNVQSLSR